jgi:hypothetical protein
MASGINYPWWLRCIGYGFGGALVAAMFSDVLFGLGMIVLPLSDPTFERWADNPPVGILCLLAGLLVAVFSAGLELGARHGRTEQ